MTRTVDVSVVVRTVGRPTLITETLTSLASCDPLPAEVVVVHQSPERWDPPGFGLPCLRIVRSRGRGRALALNEGLRAARHRFALVVDDDCRVRSDWAAAGYAAMLEDPEGIVTGRVNAGGPDPRAVPSTMTFERPREYTGETTYGALASGNMACAPAAVLRLGGFDERIYPAAEDCDFCYRWLSAGRRLRYLPELVVWHCDWRSPAQLRQVYRQYAESRGRFYAKHLRAGDPRMLRFIAEEYYGWSLAIADAAFKRVPRWADERREVPLGVPAGLIRGWRDFRPEREPTAIKPSSR